MCCWQLNTWYLIHSKVPEILFLFLLESLLMSHLAFLKKFKQYGHTVHLRMIFYLKKKPTPSILYRYCIHPNCKIHFPSPEHGTLRLRPRTKISGNPCHCCPRLPCILHKSQPRRPIKDPGVRTASRLPLPAALPWTQATTRILLPPSRRRWWKTTLSR